jgi:hypothetical protein
MIFEFDNEALKHLDPITRDVMLEDYADELREEGYSEYAINQMIHAIEFDN